ncbi:MGH1-like glycoside hydrolase domain-containing protein [Terrimonas pollutisoli]|uniref:MGH1-like glycoside hydrolase domain-containing protein n=1 Tax=Terrimonas pollutisoli TaxID=3034147 RepID=UPI0034DF42EA
MFPDKYFHRLCTGFPPFQPDDPAFDSNGEYWRGAVWAPTTYMVLRGLTNYGKDSLAYEIALNYLDKIT